MPGLVWEYWNSVSISLVNTDVRVSFPTPAGPPTTGADLQEFRVAVRKKGTGDNPYCRIELWENGAKKADALADTAVSSTTGVVLSGTWDASLLTTANGSLVECKVVGAGAVDGSLEVGAIEWNASVDAAAGQTLTGGFRSSEERTFGASLTPGPVTLTGGFRASEERTFGASLGIPVVNTSVEVSFPTPSSVLESGSALQEMRVLVRKAGTGGNPNCTLELWQNGVKKRDLLSNQTISSSVILSSTFDATELDTLQGQNVRLRVVGNGAAGGAVEVGAIEWNATLSAVSQISGGFVAPEERTFGARIHGPVQTLTSGFRSSEERTFGLSVSPTYIQGGFTGGDLAPGDWAPGDFVLPLRDERTFGGSVTGPYIQGGKVASEERSFGGAITPGTANLVSGFVKPEESSFGAAITPGEVYIQSGFSPSEERTFGGVVVPGALTVLGGFIPSEEYTFGGAIVGSAQNLIGGFRASEERTFGGALTTGASIQNIFAGFVAAEERTLGGVLLPGPVTITGGFRSSEERTFGGQLQIVSIQSLTGGFVKTEERSFGGSVVVLSTRVLTGGFRASEERTFGGVLIIGAPPLGDTPLYPDAILAALGYPADADVSILRDDPENPADTSWLSVV